MYKYIYIYIYNFLVCSEMDYHDFVLVPPLDKYAIVLYHRVYLASAEAALQKFAPNLVLPYYEYTATETSLPDLVKNQTVWDPIDEKWVHNPLYSGYLPYHNFTTWRILNHTRLFPEPDEKGHTCYYNMVYRAMTAPDYKTYIDTQTKPHIIYHFNLDSPTTFATAFDPIFYIYHVYLDKLLAIIQEKLKYLRKDILQCFTSKEKEMLRSDIKVFRCDEAHKKGAEGRYLTPTESWDYEQHYGYTYDNLEYHGISAVELAKTPFLPEVPKKGKCKWPWEA